jgi:hypothetical protein
MNFLGPARGARSPLLSLGVKTDRSRDMSFLVDRPRIARDPTEAWRQNDSSREMSLGTFDQYTRVSITGLASN